MTKPLIRAYCDGACSVHKSKTAGWATILQFDSKLGVVEKVMVGKIPNATNNVGECVAIQEALKAIKLPSRIEFHTDSKDAIGWVYGWSVVYDCPDPKKKWKRKNPALRVILEEIDSLIKGGEHDISFKWVVGIMEIR